MNLSESHAKYIVIREFGDGTHYVSMTPSYERIMTFLNIVHWPICFGKLTVLKVREDIKDSSIFTGVGAWAFGKVLSVATPETSYSDFMKPLQLPEEVDAHMALTREDDDGINLHPDNSDPGIPQR
jgi:hypothetical protein